MLAVCLRSRYDPPAKYLIVQCNMILQEIASPLDNLPNLSFIYITKDYFTYAGNCYWQRQ